MEIILIAIALAMDSVAVSIAIGTKFKKISLPTILKASFYFGLFQGLMPLIGYFVGLSFAGFFYNFDYIIAFLILSYLGYRMIKEGKEESEEDEIENLKNITLLIFAIATSIDALAIGITFSFQETNIYYATTVIMIITFILCIFATYLGKALGNFFKNKAHYLGGTILILIGVNIFLKKLYLIF